MVYIFSKDIRNIRKACKNNAPETAGMPATVWTLVNEVKPVIAMTPATDVTPGTALKQSAQEFRGD
jgi:hypothetical protein